MSGIQKLGICNSKLRFVPKSTIGRGKRRKIKTDRQKKKYIEKKRRKLKKKRGNSRRKKTEETDY